MSRIFIPPNSITPWAPESLGDKLAGLGINMTAAASALYPTANMAIYVPFYLVTPCTIANVFWYNGTLGTVANVDVGVYAADGTKLISSGSTAQSGASALQAVDVTDTQIGTGLGFIGIACDNILGMLFALALGNIGLTCLVGMYSQLTAFALPATMTPVDPSQDYLPVFGFTPRSVV